MSNLGNKYRRVLILLIYIVLLFVFVSFWFLLLLILLHISKNLCEFWYELETIGAYGEAIETNY